MSLRLRINLIITAMILLFTIVALVMQVRLTRVSVGEEIEASTRVALQLLTRVSTSERQATTQDMQTFLQQLGRVRANDIVLLDSTGTQRYQSPPSQYKAGRSAPEWFSREVAPVTTNRLIALADGRIEIRPDATRAVLDGWDDLTRLLQIAAVIFVLVNLALYWLAGRLLRPLNTVVDGLLQLQRGNYAVRLPAMRSPELRRIGESFNQMAQAVNDSIVARGAEAKALAELAQNRALTEEIQSRIEQERGEIARELHDELGQQITAIKTLGLSIAQRTAASDPSCEQAARLVMNTADQIYEVIHHMIPKLRPLALDHFGLADAVEDLVSDWRGQNSAIAFDCRIALHDQALPDKVATAAYRIVQESINNAVRHSGASRIRIELAINDACLNVEITDNGSGLIDNWRKSGHFGVIGMQERAHALDGTLTLQAAKPHGLSICARLPIIAQPTATATATSTATATATAVAR